jgi:omega-6 fatty acid desaturase (delta-12 desaturase)
MFKSSSWLSVESKSKFVEKSNWKTVLIFIGQAIIYILCLIGALADYSSLANLILSVFLGLVIGQTFLIGHDACHQAFAKNSSLNKLIGRIALSWTLHSYTLWHLEHNIRHHGYTNIIGKDPSWSPFTKEEYDQLSSIRKILEHFYRGPLGAGAYYIIEMWLKIHAFPVGPNARSEWKRHFLDSALVIFVFVIQILGISHLGKFVDPGKSLPEILLLGWIVPFLTWNWLMGFAIYLHHTHPAIPWFTQDKRPSFNHIQIHATTHVIFPIPLTYLFYNIMEHTAHHLQPSIPMYKLYSAQKQLEQKYGDRIVRYQWSFKEYFRITKVCKLFDPERNCWTDFNGNPTSPQIFKPKHQASISSSETC